MPGKVEKPMKEAQAAKSAERSKAEKRETEAESIDVDAELQQIYDDALTAGLSPRQVQECFNAEIYFPKKGASKRWMVASAAMIPLAVLIYLVAYRADMIQDSVEYMDAYLQERQCLIEQNPFTMEMLRPLANCSAMCQGLEDGVPRLETISKEDFMNNFAKTGRPLLVTGVASKWPALDVSLSKLSSTPIKMHNYGKNALYYTGR